MESSAWEDSFWQLVSMLFTGLYLESNPGMDNEYLKDFFEVEIKVDILLLRMVLDVVTKCLKQVEMTQEAFENSAFLNSSQRFDRDSILNDIHKAENEDFLGFNNSRNFDEESNYSSARDSNRNFLSLGETPSRGGNRTSILPKNDYGFKIDLAVTKKQTK